MFSSESFDFPFPTDSFDTMNGIDVGIVLDSRPDSRASVTPVSTPRPPSAFSPATVCQSPNNNNNNNNNLNNNNNSVYMGTISFPNFDEKDSKEHIQQHVQSQMLQMQQHQHQIQAQHSPQLQQKIQQNPHNSDRLRTLLTNTKRSGMDNEHDQRAQNKILKGLLDTDEEKNNAFNKLAGPNQQITIRGVTMQQQHVQKLEVSFHNPV